ncbi:hypothetical protein H6F43_02870 [Leptolyngbya sp. FACHB-36]|uniref:hypothetical protein n=1 Tax=Leptolyngbya sp. FACHB-36 TaxID=2692808 RepID=UPI001680472E|nr:hypothetical protein [Leptolyngbya sp. FACHB-36]MBD2019127.1 hypothetical protein [Leptolyngbya sp. FACHB-36]
MHRNYYGIRIASTCTSQRWKWQLALPIGSVVTSNTDYETPEQALQQGAYWLSAEAAFNALSSCLSDLCGAGALCQQEYCVLMYSFLQITQHR